MTEFSYTIKDKDGIHARPAGLFVQKMQGFKSTVLIEKDDGTNADGKKLIALMKLRVKCAQTITVKAEGEDEAATVDAAKEFLTANL